jgi:hypothetical protein
MRPALRVDPDDPDTVYGYEQVEVPGLPPHDEVGGLGAYFHRGHFPGAPLYRQAPEPQRSG